MINKRIKQLRNKFNRFNIGGYIIPNPAEPEKFEINFNRSLDWLTYSLKYSSFFGTK